MIYMYLNCLFQVNDSLFQQSIYGTGPGTASFSQPFSRCLIANCLVGSNIRNIMVIRIIIITNLYYTLYFQCRSVFTSSTADLGTISIRDSTSEDLISTRPTSKQDQTLPGMYTCAGIALPCIHATSSVWLLNYNYMRTLIYMNGLNTVL